MILNTGVQDVVYSPQLTKELKCLIQLKQM